MMHRSVIMAFMILFVTACSDYTEELPGGYYFASEAKDNQVIVHQGWRAGDPYISCNVEAYDADNRYIVAMQRVSMSCFWGEDNSLSAFAGQKLFWIIDSKKHQFYGPYSEQREFESKRLEYGISVSLEQ